MVALHLHENESERNGSILYSSHDDMLLGREQKMMILLNFDVSICKCLILKNMKQEYNSTTNPNYDKVT